MSSLSAERTPAAYLRAARGDFIINYPPLVEPAKTKKILNATEFTAPPPRQPSTSKEFVKAHNTCTSDCCQRTLLNIQKHAPLVVLCPRLHARVEIKRRFVILTSVTLSRPKKTHKKPIPSLEEINSAFTRDEKPVKKIEAPPFTHRQFPRDNRLRNLRSAERDHPSVRYSLPPVPLNTQPQLVEYTPLRLDDYLSDEEGLEQLRLLRSEPPTWTADPPRNIALAWTVELLSYDAQQTPNINVDGVYDLPFDHLTHSLPTTSYFGLEQAFKTQYPNRSSFFHTTSPSSKPCFGLDGVDDLPEGHHDNLSNFRFFFPAVRETEEDKSGEKGKERSSVYSKGDSGLRRPRAAPTQSSLEPFPFGRPEDSAPLTTPNLFSRQLRTFKNTLPTVIDGPFSPSSKRPDRSFSAAASQAPSTPTLSPGVIENTPPRSLKRVIRADDFWKNKGNKKVPSDLPQTPQTAINRGQPIEPEKTPTAAPSKRGGDFEQEPTEQELTFKRSSEFLRAVQPLVTPEKPSPSPAQFLTLAYSNEELRPRPLSLQQKKEFLNVPHIREPITDETGPLLIEEPDDNTTRITRQQILEHLVSSESLRSLLTPSKPKLCPEARAARRAGVIYERVFISSPSSETSETSSRNMELLHPESAAAMTEHRREAVRLAQAQEKAVVDKCKRGGQEMPKYAFDELIGKGSFGRVYKGRQTTTSKVVAIKVIDIDEADFHSVFEQKDEQIKDFNREIRILKQAQDSGAPNMNQMIEALPVHSQLWLVCEYCPGGSVKTLMRATNDRLAEKYILVVARELSKALKGLHEAGIMHRDIKAANVLIHEEGRLQLCDFGVATVLDTKGDKRKTFIGTPHWMPPELFVENPEYSDEVDVWEFGCTLYECAIGKPPHSDLRERQQLASRMRRLKQSISLPEHENFSDGLRSLVSYTLSPDPRTRPSMKDVLLHEYLVDTEITHPTSILSQLVKVYYAWLFGGGQRASLFMPGGAVVSEGPGSITTPIDEWNFSTTEIFEKRISSILDIPDFSEMDTLEDSEGDTTPRGSRNADITSPPLNEMTNVQKANFEKRVQRGADLSYLFDQAKPNYEYKTKTDFRPLVEERRVSDLPFRAMAEDRPTSIASNVIDLGDFDSDDYAIAAPKKEDTTIQLADAATIRAKRGDSKGPARDRSATASLTAKRGSLADEDLTGDELSSTSAQDFAFPPKEWTIDDKAKGRTTESTSEETLIKDAGRKTMDWTFASAMTAPPDADDDESQAVISQQTKAAKHATLEWSFSNAMAAASESDEPNRSSRTPGRPAPLMRTMTQPVTSSEVYTAEEFPRPSTALSEAFSESSMSSADMDPFVLEGDQTYPDPSSIDQMGMPVFYNSRGGSLVPEHIVPYNQTIAGPAPYMFGGPARIGDDTFPGPASQGSGLPSTLGRPSPKGKRHGRGRKNTSDSSSSGGRPKVEMPEAVAPSDESMRVDARPEVMESELSRLLGGIQASLAGASQALGQMRRVSGGKDRGRKVKRSSSEWTDEE